MIESIRRLRDQLNAAKREHISMIKAMEYARKTGRTIRCDTVISKAEYKRRYERLRRWKDQHDGATCEEPMLTKLLGPMP